MHESFRNSLVRRPVNDDNKATSVAVAKSLALERMNHRCSSTKESVMDLKRAREVVADHLAKTLKRRGCFESPGVVRDYLIHYFAGREHEVFVVLFLDAQNRL